MLELLDELSEQEHGYEGVGFGESDRSALEALVHRAEADSDLGEMTDEEFAELTTCAGSGTTLTIHDLTTAEVSAFRALPGENDAQRLRGLLGDA